MDLDKLIGDKIKDKREKLKLSQYDLSVMTGMSRSSIVNIERGHQAAPLKKLLILCFALNTSISEMLEGFKIESAIDKETFVFVKNKFPETYKQILSQMISIKLKTK